MKKNKFLYVSFVVGMICLCLIVSLRFGKSNVQAQGLPPYVLTSCQGDIPAGGLETTCAVPLQCPAGYTLIASVRGDNDGDGNATGVDFQVGLCMLTSLQYSCVDMELRSCEGAGCVVNCGILNAVSTVQTSSDGEDWYLTLCSQ